MPAPSGHQAEAVARGRCPGDAPACGRRRDRCDALRPQEQQREASFACGVMQSLARLKIHLAAEDAGDGCRAVCAERFLRGPKGFGFVGGFDQRQACGGKAECVEACAMGASAAHELFCGEEEKQRRFLGHPAKKREHEAEG